MPNNCKTTCIDFSPFCKNKQKSPTIQSQLQKIPKIKKRVQNYDGLQAQYNKISLTQKSITTNTLLTQRIKTHGLGFYPKQSSSLQKRQQYSQQIPKQKNTITSIHTKHNNIGDDIKIAFNYTNYYMNNRINKRIENRNYKQYNLYNISALKREHHSYTQQNNAQESAQSPYKYKLQNRRSKNKTMNSSVYKVLHNHRFKIKKNSQSQRQVRQTNTDGKYQGDNSQQYDNNSNIKIKYKHTQIPKHTQKRISQLSLNKLAANYDEIQKLKQAYFPHNISKQNQHKILISNILKKKVSKCHEYRVQQERMLTISNPKIIITNSQTLNSKQQYKLDTINSDTDNMKNNQNPQKTMKMKKISEIKYITSKNNKKKIGQKQGQCEQTNKDRGRSSGLSGWDTKYNEEQQF